VGRTAARLIALAALLAGVAAVVVVLLSLGGGSGGGDGSSRSADAHRPAASHPPHAPRQAKLPALTPVRNASPQPDWAPYSGPVPILRYHAIGVPSTDETYT
jgi:hypothetical protein